jgi:hypothetical protein
VKHSEDVGLEKASDPEVLSRCCAEERLLVTADCPSVLITRNMRTLNVDDVGAILIANLPQIDRLIAKRGHAVFSLAPGQPIRAQLLPLGVAMATATE